MNFFKKCFLLVLLLVLLPSFLMAQEKSGRIQGVVSDSTTGSVLFGANILLEGTSLGAATDFDGKYTITGIPVGSYNLLVRYIGYEQKEFSIKVVENRTVQLDVALLTEVIEGEEIVVTGQAQGQRQAINQQLTANTIINVVSSEKIHRLPDDNAAAALSRLPGVSLMNGDQVVIRGVEAKFNQVLVNGVQLPSTDMENRSTNLGFISSNMLSGIEVVKAPTPDMDANALGGVVNLRLRQAPEDLHFDLLSQGSYNAQGHIGDNHKFWFSVSDRFFDNKLGVFIQASLDRSNVGDQSARMSYEILGTGNSQYGQAVYRVANSSMQDNVDVTENKGGSIILDYKLPHGKIVFQNTFAYTFSDYRHYTNTMNLNSTPTVNYTMFRDRFGKDLLVNSLQADNLFGDLKVELGLSHSYSDKFTKIRYGDDGSNFYFQNVSAIQAPYGFDENGNPKVYSNQLQTLTMNDVYKIFDNLNPADADSATLEGWINSSTQAFKQHLYNVTADLSMPVTFSKDITAIFKAGGKFTRTTRTNDPNSYFSGSSDESDTYAMVKDFFPGVKVDQKHHVRYTYVSQYDSKRGDYFLNDEYNFKNGFQYQFNVPLYDAWLTQAMTGWTPPELWSETWHNDFNGAEIFSAGYLMGTFDLFSRLTLITGLRYEFYNMKYKANFTYVTHGVYGNSISSSIGGIKDSDGNLLPESIYNVDRTDENIFPAVLLKYKVNDWADLRFAYTNGISRPDYLSILPKTYYVSDYNTIEVGNPTLKPTTVQNFDLGVSFYGNEIGLLTIGGFIKKLENESFPVTVYYKYASNYNIPVPDSAIWADYKLSPPLPTTPLTTTVNNNNPGYIKGLEFDWQTNFWYLPKPFNSFVLDVNYTMSTSEMDYHQVLARDSTYRDERGRLKTVNYNVDTIRTARLLHQADDVLNIALGFDYKGFSGRISFNMQGNVINYLNPQGRPETDQYTGNIYRWDFTLKQELPIKGLSIAVNGINIFHNPIYIYQKFRRDVDLPVTENLQQVLYSPTMFQANLRYSF